MKTYIIAGQEISFTYQFPRLERYQFTGVEITSNPVTLSLPENLISHSTGWVASAERNVEIWSAGDGLVLRVSSFRDFYIAPRGTAILPVVGDSDLTGLEQEVVLGPALALALALGGKWCLHASAAFFHNIGIAFLGESGYGKSTLASYVDDAGKPGWQRIADDILPVSIGEGGLTGWPHFPQLKLPLDEHPGQSLPEKILVERIFKLEPIKSTKTIAIERLSTNAAVKVLLGQIAGARLFTPALTEKNLAFCAQAARLVSVYRLSYPHRRDILPIVRELLERCLSVDLPIENKLTINLNDDK